MALRGSGIPFEKFDTFSMFFFNYFLSYKKNLNIKNKKQKNPDF